MTAPTRRDPVDTSVEPKQPDLSLGELFGKFTSDMGTLFRKEVELARVETREELQTAARASGMLVGGLLLAYMALLLMSFAAVWALDEVMPIALAFVIVGAVHAIVAAVLVTIGRRRMHEVEPLRQTTRTIKEDVQWARAQMS